MSDGIVSIIQKYNGEPVSLSYTAINHESWEKEFYALFQQLMPHGARWKLEDDIKKLPGLSIQELLLGSDTATYDQAAYVVSIELGELIVRSRGKYASLRGAGMTPEVAFKDSIREIGELIHAVQSGEIPEDFSLLVKRQLNLPYQFSSSYL